MLVQLVKRRLFVVLLVVAVSAVGYFVFRTPELGTRESLNILIVGISGVVTAETTPSAPDDSAPIADSVALLSLHPKRQTAHLLIFPSEISVPPDPHDPLAPFVAPLPLSSLVDGHGAESLVAFVESTLDVPVHHVIRIDSLSLGRLADRVGGVRVQSGAEANDGSDASFTASDGLLVGDDMVAVMQSSARRGGASHVALQHTLYKTSLAVLRGYSRLVHLEDLVQFAGRHVESDLPSGRVWAVAKFLHRLADQRIHIDVVPGQFVANQYRLDEAEVAVMVGRTFDNRDRPLGDVR